MSSDSDSVDNERARSFTCIECGYAIEREVSLLQDTISTVCVHCGEYSVYAADHADLEQAGQDAADALADVGYLTERQAKAYVYRELLGFTRERTATVMDTSKSNVDNLQHRAREKITQARRIVDVLRGLDNNDNE